MSTEEQIIGLRKKKKKILLLLLKVMLIDMVICCPRTPEDEELCVWEVVYGVGFLHLWVREGLRCEPCVCDVLLVLSHSSSANFYNHRT